MVTVSLSNVVTSVVASVVASVVTSGWTGFAALLCAPFDDDMKTCIRVLIVNEPLQAAVTKLVDMKIKIEGIKDEERSPKVNAWLDEATDVEKRSDELLAPASSNLCECARLRKGCARRKLLKEVNEVIWSGNMIFLKAGTGRPEKEKDRKKKGVVSPTAIQGTPNTDGASASNGPLK